MKETKPSIIWPCHSFISYSILQLILKPAIWHPCIFGGDGHPYNAATQNFTIFQRFNKKNKRKNKSKLKVKWNLAAKQWKKNDWKWNEVASKFKSKSNYIIKVKIISKLNWNPRAIHGEIKNKLFIKSKQKSKWISPWPRAATTMILCGSDCMSYHTLCPLTEVVKLFWSWVMLEELSSISMSDFREALWENNANLKEAFLKYVGRGLQRRC